eukprot:jgi/Botrbrau1/6302/Bobra.0339s0013.1
MGAAAADPTLQEETKHKYALGAPPELPCDDKVYGTNPLDCTEAEWQARVDLAAAYRILENMNMVDGINNHLTATIPGEPNHFLVHPFGLKWSEVTASNLVKVDVDGNVVSGRGFPEATAFWIHSRLHMGREDRGIPTGCVMHTHQPWTSALLCLQEPEFPMIHQNCLFFYDSIVFEDYNGLVLDNSEGLRLAEVLGHKSVLLHKNHGVMVCGKTVAQAFDSIYYLEKASEIIVKAMSCGRPLNIIPTPVCEDFKAKIDKIDGEYGRLLLEGCKRELLRGKDADFLT